MCHTPRWVGRHDSAALYAYPWQRMPRGRSISRDASSSINLHLARRLSTPFDGVSKEVFDDTPKAFVRLPRPPMSLTIGAG